MIDINFTDNFINDKKYINKDTLNYQDVFKVNSRLKIKSILDHNTVTNDMNYNDYLINHPTFKKPPPLPPKLRVIP